MIKSSLTGAAAFIVAASLIPTPASAQKSKDTFRVAFLEATQNVDSYTDPKPESNFLSAALLDTLVEFDGLNNKFEPLLATSWKQIDDKTLEVKLKKSVKWTDGEEFDADDVVYTFNWVTDKKTKLRFKRNWNWIARTEKVDRYTVRIHAKRPTPFAVARLAEGSYILPQHVHAPLEKKIAFGSKPVGTGPYRATQVNRNTGIKMVKNPDYKHGTAGKAASNIGNVHVIPIPDRGAQIAQALAGNVDAIRALTFDEAEGLAKDPRYTFHLAQSLSYIYLYFDLANRSGIGVFKDKRVREAVAMAVNRDIVPTIRSGNKKLPRGNPQGLCWKLQNGCGYSVPLPEYNIAKAKKLLAEAGYAKGFDVKLTAFNSVKDFAEVISGQLRNIGIRATVNAVTFPAYRKQQRDNKIELMANAWSAGSMADVAGTMNFFFLPGPRDYLKKPGLHKLSRQINATMDDSKRRQLTKQLLDETTRERLIFPVSGLPLPLVLSSDATLRGGRIQPFGFYMTDVNWK
ncbi:MAG: hypothetical protein HQ503_01960 [Rhodospirillales bacterium]|nr:hypothetical protein [Rhodospirillales bacterium]